MIELRGRTLDTPEAVSGDAVELAGGDSSRRILPCALGCARFRADYNLKYAYVAGAMYKGIASRELVVAMGRAGMMGYFGTGGLDLDEIESAIQYIRKELTGAQSFGMNLLLNLERPEVEENTVNLYLREGVRFVEAAAFMQIAPSLVRFRLSGARRTPSGIEAPNRILAKVSRPEVASMFFQPPPQEIVDRLFKDGQIDADQAQLSRSLPMAQEICVEADSGGHTDRGVMSVLMPAMLELRDHMAAKHNYSVPLRVGAAGGIGTPLSAAAAFVMGADFILTGSINQCTVEAGTSDAVKNLLEDINVQHTGYAPAGDMFEFGAKVQVLKRSLLFPGRANRLYELYGRYQSIDEIDGKTKLQIQEKYFNRSFAEVWAETRVHYLKCDPPKLREAERDPKKAMALIFKWYFIYSTRLALEGNEEHQADFQVHCGPALGAFNQWVKNSPLERWRNRHVGDIGDRIMRGAAEVLSTRLIGYLAH